MDRGASRTLASLLSIMIPAPLSQAESFARRQFPGRIVFLSLGGVVTVFSFDLDRLVYNTHPKP
eukprot:SAG31_NODE_8997_length_1350_cov_1.596323_2_plen_63_part_01